MSQTNKSVFPHIKKLVRNHLADAENKHTGPSGENPGPTPEQSYSQAFGTATGAYGARGITAAEWANLHTEIRDHRSAFQGHK